VSRKVLAGLAVVAASGTAAVAPASAHTTVFPTTIHVTQAATTPVGGGFQVEVNGYLTSPTSKCRKSRTVKLYLIAGGTTTLKDVDLSSLRGEFGVRGKTVSHPDAFTIKVIRKRIDRRLGPSHRHVCGGAKVTEG
jgi:hypothetical protein